MSAFGHAGFGSSNRRNQLRAQGQIGGQDPYGNQVRNAMQTPTMTAYQAPAAYQQASGQQQASTQATRQPAQSQSQGTQYAQPPAAAPRTSGQSWPAWNYPGSDNSGTPEDFARFMEYAKSKQPPAPPKQDWLQSMSDEELNKSLSNWIAAGTSGPGGQFSAENIQAARAELARRGQNFDAVGARRQQLQGDIDRVDRQIQEWNDRAAPGSPRIGETFLVDGRPDDQWMQANQYWANQRRQAQSALDSYNAENPVIQTGGPGRTMPPELQTQRFRTEETHSLKNEMNALQNMLDTDPDAQRRLQELAQELTRRGETYDPEAANRSRLQGELDAARNFANSWATEVENNPGLRLGPGTAWGTWEGQWQQSINERQAALDDFNRRFPMASPTMPGGKGADDPRLQQTTPNDIHAGYWDGDTWIQTGGPGRMAPGMAQPIQPQSQGTPYGMQAITGGDFPIRNF